MHAAPSKGDGNRFRICASDRRASLKSDDPLRYATCHPSDECGVGQQRPDPENPLFLCDPCS